MEEIYYLPQLFVHMFRVSNLKNMSLNTWTKGHAKMRRMKYEPLQIIMLILMNLKLSKHGTCFQMLVLVKTEVIRLDAFPGAIIKGKQHWSSFNQLQGAKNKNVIRAGLWNSIVLKAVRRTFLFLPTFRAWPLRAFYFERSIRCTHLVLSQNILGECSPNGLHCWRN